MLYSTLISQLFDKNKLFTTYSIIENYSANSNFHKKHYNLTYFALNKKNSIKIALLLFTEGFNYYGCEQTKSLRYGIKAD